MTLFNVVMCWLIANEILLLALLRVASLAQDDECDKPNRGNFERGDQDQFHQRYSGSSDRNKLRAG